MSPPRPTPGAPVAARIPARDDRHLANGMRATFVRVGAVPLAAVRLVIRTGSADVAAGQGWLDRFAHDYLREGTEGSDAVAFADALAAIGGRLAIDADEHTTVLHTEVLAEHAPRAITLLAEVARHPRFPDGEAPRLRADLRRSLDLALAQPQYLAFAAFRAALYPGHPYGRVVPDPAAFDAFDAAVTRAYWAAQSGAQRALLLVGGMFDAEPAARAWRAAFEDWAPGAPPAEHRPTPASGRTVRLVDRPGAEQSTVYVGRVVPDPTQPDYVPLEVANFLLAGSFHSRITMNIREAKGYTYSPRGLLSSRPHDAHWVEVADVTTEVTGAAIGEVFHEIERLRGEAPSAEELLGIQNYASGSFVIRQATPGGILDHLEFLDLHGLDEGYSAAYVDRVRAVTPGDVRRIAEQYLGTEAMTIAIAGDRARVDEQVAAFGTPSG
ncbi:MAG: insulinase family protein [Dehalococcoidia bacterium]|nr:insulinase family protein [Dehalococcoidia bacterium]